MKTIQFRGCGFLSKICNLFRVLSIQAFPLLKVLNHLNSKDCIVDTVHTSSAYRLGKTRVIIMHRILKTEFDKIIRIVLKKCHSCIEDSSYYEMRAPIRVVTRLSVIMTRVD